MTCTTSQSESGWAQGLCFLDLFIHKPLGQPSTGGQLGSDLAWRQGTPKIILTPLLGVGTVGKAGAGLTKESHPPQINF